MLLFTISVFCNHFEQAVGGWESVTVALEHYFETSDLFQMYLVYFTGLIEL